MSISTPSGEQKNPSSVKVSGKPAAKPSAKPGGRPGAKPSSGGKGPRKPVSPVKVGGGRNWGPIALFVAVGVIAVGIIGFAAWPAFRPGGAGYSWETRANGIPGIVNYRANGTELVRDHAYGQQQYAQTPPVGGKHNEVWQQCSGNVYDSVIPSEHAVHSLEHGAVWLTYRTGLPADQVEKLASKIRGKEFTLMSPVDNLDSAVSLQAWGYQLKLDSATDKRIDEFIRAARGNVGLEPGAACSGGISETGTEPFDLSSTPTMPTGG